MTGDAPEQRRVMTVLVGAQVLSGAGLAAGITVGALLARDLMGSTAMAGMPAMVFTVGAAVFALGVGRLSHRYGRRVGLSLGYLAGAVGSTGVVIAATLANVPLLFVSLFIYGAGSAANLQARYSGADLAAPGRRGRAVGIVLVATTVGAVAGPNLASATGHMALSLGMPALSGPFVLAGVAYALGAGVLWLFLRPDPLLTARRIDRDHEPEPLAVVDVVHTPARHRPQESTWVRGAVVMIVAQMVMIAVMTMTPLHMDQHGHGMGAIGIVIGVHVAAMFLPAPLSGFIVDTWGARRTAWLSAGVFVLAGVVGAFSPPSSVVLLTVSLALLGLGWSLGLVAGTAMVTEAVSVRSRAKVQGNVDALVTLAGASGGALSGLVMAQASFAVLALAGGVVALALVPVLLWSRAPGAKRLQR